MSRPATTMRRALAVTILCAATLMACKGHPQPIPKPRSTAEALVALRTELGRLIAASPPQARDSSAALGELAARGRAELREVRERPAALAAETLAPFLAGRELGDADPIRMIRSSFHGDAYSIASRKVRVGGRGAWLEIVDPAGSPELLVPFEVARAAAGTSSDARYQATTVGGFPAIASTRGAASIGPAILPHTVQVLVGDRLLVGARAAAEVPAEELAELVAKLDLDGLARVASGAPTSPSPTTRADPTEAAEDG